MKDTPRKETDGSLALSFFLFKRNMHSHTYTHTYKHTKDVFQAVSVKIYGSPLRDEHMEQSSNFQLLLWRFSSSPTRILCVMWGCVSELAVDLRTLGLQSRALQQAALFGVPGSQDGKHVFVSSNAVKTKKGCANSWGNRQWSRPPKSGGFMCCTETRHTGLLCQDEHAYVCNHALRHKRLPVTQIASCISSCLIISRSFFMRNSFHLNKLPR